MSEKYIRKNKKSCSIVKGSHTFARLNSLEDAMLIRDLLVSIGWNLDDIPQIIEKDGNYLILSVYDEKICLLAKYRQKPDEDTVEKLVKKHRRNPNNSRYGLNISRIMNTYIITKQIAGEGHIFGMYDNLKDAEFVRNFLMDHHWNVNEFGEIEYDEDTDTYKAVLVIDECVYVLDSFDSADIDLDEVYGEFLTRISKHKYGLANYPHLDRLKNKIGELEDELNVKAADDVWIFGEGIEEEDALTDIIFTLAPFEKSVYDAIDSMATADEIKHKLIRFKTKNFEEKISRNLDGLIEKGLIKKVGDYYIKC
ncbi:hypothetical protein [Methanobrevibacter sp.]|uniref:hypothetical protein n=1 Tax=Methanobrevibacter sp. TaxID=66852 RepID=UPI00388EF5B2